MLGVLQEPASRHPGYPPRLLALPRVLWNPHPGPGGSPNPAPVGSRTLASLAAGPWTLHLGLRLPALKARLRGPGLREGAGAAPSQGCAASARSSEPSPGSDAGCGSAGLRAAGRAGGAERGGEPPAGLGFRSRSPSPGRRREMLVPPCRLLQASIPPPFMRPSVHSYHLHSFNIHAAGHSALRAHLLCAGGPWAASESYSAGGDPSSTSPRCLT